MSNRVLVALLASLAVAACGGKQSTNSGIITDGSSNHVDADSRGSTEDGLEFDFKGPDGGLKPEMMTGDGFQVGQCNEYPRPFECPCDGNGDCQSGYCISTGSGSQCTMQCIEECPNGWTCKGMEGFGLDLVFLCVPPYKPLCVPCTDDVECSEGKCLDVGGEDNCLFACEDASQCPLGFECLSHDGDEGNFCTPMTNSCTCLVQNIGQVRPCTAENDFGSCLGFETCTETDGWDDCTAIAPSEEICDYLDNDCDGQVDEDFLTDGKYASDDNCGSCSVSCEDAIPNGSASCDKDLPNPQCSVDECDPGYYQANPFQCFPEGADQCKPCYSDDQCGGGVCVTLDDQAVCLQACQEDDCPEFSKCGELEGEEGQWCIPESGSCSCTGSNDGAIRPCSVPNDFGICFGQESCDPTKGWVDCDAATPKEEVCDGLDNDCDGKPDNGVGGGGECAVEVEGIGSCTGVEVCLPAEGLVCTAPTPALETCDYQDNDCDGEIDEDFRIDGQYVSLHHCGSCTKDCEGALTNAIAYCDGSGETPACKVDECLPGFYPLNDFQCIVPPDVQCNECDDADDCFDLECRKFDGLQHCLKACAQFDDCKDGYECADLGQGDLFCVPVTGTCQCTVDSGGGETACKKENEFGICYGSMVCDPEAGWGDCQAKVPEPESCNNIDDDCNGLTDDGLPQGQLCTVSNDFGECPGVDVCTGEEGWVCQGQEPAPEVCDYVDNNCDGSVDENFVNEAGDYNTFDHCGSCTVSCAIGFPNATAMCDDSSSPPKCVVETCNDGFFKLNEFQCIPNIATLCEACSTDENCASEGAKCVQLDDGKFCAKACTDDQDCPAGYHCSDYEGSLQCMPQTNSCECDGINTDLSKACKQTWPADPGPHDPYITCFGTQQCTAQGWTECALPEEVCDGADNDCNGTIDDGFLTDGKYVADTNCGQCGNNCTFLQFPNGYGVCDADKAVPDCVMECEPGSEDVNNNPADGCECTFASETDEPDGIDQNCDGVDGELGNSIFVAKNGSDENDGSIEAPMLSIQGAIDAAADQGKRDVYVATGVYAGSVELKAGVKLYGGYASDFQTRDALLYETVIMGGASTAELPGAVNALNVTGNPGSTVVDGFTIFGKNNNEPGSSSYAVYLRNVGSALSFANNRVEAGVGGFGGKGDDGINGTPGSAGTPGDDAFGAETANCDALNPDIPRPGAAGGAEQCNSGTDTAGGTGGGNTCPNQYDAAPVDYENGTAGAGTDPGDGGVGGYDREVWYCWTFPGGECHQATGGNEVGNTGQSGGAGDHGETDGGNGCSLDDASGQVVNGQWVGSTGLSGDVGENGSGGGGGGAGGGAQDGSGCSDRTHIGGSGGGGGSGGCAGTGGSGGGAGGGSFALFIVFDNPPATIPGVAGNTLVGSVGGAGGNGGNGGSGGAGGAGGAGGGENFDDAKCAAPGGNGGIGGHGGHGEGGGGGCGGAAYCIFAYGQGDADLSAYKDDNDFITGSGGPGGSGGPSIGNPGDAGASGASGTTNF